jgi:hypothetical protein
LNCSTQTWLFSTPGALAPPRFDKDNEYPLRRHKTSLTHLKDIATTQPCADSAAFLARHGTIGVDMNYFFDGVRQLKPVVDNKPIVQEPLPSF